MISTKYIIRRRGDTKRIRVCVKGATNAEDISGAEFRFTVHRLPYPKDSSGQIFQVLGDIIDAVNGIVEFPIEGGNENITGFYYFDVQMIDPAGSTDTILFGWYFVRQDITKDVTTLGVHSSSHGVAGGL